MAFILVGVVFVAYLVMTSSALQLFAQQRWRQVPTLLTLLPPTRRPFGDECKWRATKTLVLDQLANQGPLRAESHVEQLHRPQPERGAPAVTLGQLGLTGATVDICLTHVRCVMNNAW